MNLFIASMIQRSGRSWWEARYSDGRVLAEWQTGSTILDKTLFPLLVNSRSSRWEEVPKEHMVGLRLLCPNGMAGELEAPEGHKFFQLKTGGMAVSVGGPGKSQHFIDAHIIGVVKDTDGNCVCRAWDYQQRKLLEFTDNIFNMRYRNIGKLSLEVQGLRV
jgi:hypothetical protein